MKKFNIKGNKKMNEIDIENLKKIAEKIKKINLIDLNIFYTISFIIPSFICAYWIKKDYLILYLSITIVVHMILIVWLWYMNSKNKEKKYGELKKYPIFEETKLFHSDYIINNKKVKEIMKIESELSEEAKEFLLKQEKEIKI